MKYIKTFFIFLSVWFLFCGLFISFSSDSYDDVSEVFFAFFTAVVSVFLYNRHFSKSKYDEGFSDGVDQATKAMIRAIEDRTETE